jgi:hypothetical protein
MRSPLSEIASETSRDWAWLLYVEPIELDERTM